jgi:hypothetical protein
MGLGLIVALAVGPLVQPRTSSELDHLRTQYLEAKTSLAVHSPFGQFLDDDPAAVQVLDRVWTLIAEWTACFVEGHPTIRSEGLVAALKGMDPDLVASAVSLSDGAFAVAASESEIGTVFVVKRTGSRTRVLWTIRDAVRAATRAADQAQLACWAAANAAMGARVGPSACGPLFGAVVGLPADGHGNPRFYVGATFAGNGLSVGGQLSIWGWNGQEARVLFIKPYGYNIDTPGGIRFSDGVLLVDTKEYMRHFLTYGPSPDPRGRWTIRITPDAIEDQGTRLDESIFQVIDELLERVAHGSTVSDLASASVSAQLEPLVQTRDGRRELNLGFVSWKRRAINGGELFTLETDDGNLDFTIVHRGRQPYVASIRIVP